MAKTTEPGGRRATTELRLGLSARGWSFPGGDEDDDAVTLWIAVGDRSYTVRVPIWIAEDGELAVGLPLVEQVPA